MARKSSRLAPRADRKFQRLNATSINFPIDQLPAELVHIICAYLKPTELVNLRLVSRNVAAISLQYLVPEVQLILAKESFEQLQALAKHPVASKHVTSFFFEADKLHALPRGTWEGRVTSPQYIEQAEELRSRKYLCRRGSERSFRSYNREVNKFCEMPNHEYSEDQMNDAFKKYNDILNFQQNSRKADVQEAKVAEAMKQFPRLKKITLSTQNHIRVSTSKMRKTIEPTFCDSLEADNLQDHPSRPIGLHQMRSLLLGAYHARLKVDHLHCGMVSWRILQQDAETFAQMKSSVSNVKDLRLGFTAVYDEYRHHPRPGLITPYSCLEEGRLRDFITAAPHLISLHVEFIRAKWPTHLDHIVGWHHWPDLKTVKLKDISTSGEDLVAFCTRHASTLKILKLHNVELLDADWLPVFSNMRKVLTLSDMEVLGMFKSQRDMINCDKGPKKDRRTRPKDVIEDYFMESLEEGAEELSLEDYMEIYCRRWADNGGRVSRGEY